jgi:hypothetical protein
LTVAGLDKEQTIVYGQLLGVGQYGPSYGAISLDPGKLAAIRGAYEETRKQIERGLSICQEIGERDLMASALRHLGHIAGVMARDAKAWGYTGMR